MRKLFYLVISVFVLSSCAELLHVANQVDLSGISTKEAGVTNAENISGLKTSLDVGIEKAVGLLGVENGFYNDAALKLLLPPEAQPIIDNITKIPGGKDLMNRTVLALNRSAEDAVNEATPIFKSAIKNMTIADAANILFGAENAATEYLKKNTYTQLETAFAPKVKTSLDKPLVVNVSTTETWNALSGAYNKVATSPVGLISGMKPVNVNIQNYVTQKALDALFIKVATEEKAIRTDPVARINDILKKVFAQLDKK